MNTRIIMYKIKAYNILEWYKVIKTILLVDRKFFHLFLFLHINESMLRTREVRKII